MSFLTPLFLFGGLALALPVLFHLSRRATRKRTALETGFKPEWSLERGIRELIKCYTVVKAGQYANV